MKQEEEQWANIEGYPDYAISNYGRVMSLRYDTILKPRLGSYGHHRVVLYRDGQAKDHYVHHLVAAAFISGYSPEYQVRHYDRDNGNNYVYNLRFPAAFRMGQLIRNPPEPFIQRVRIVGTDLIFKTVEDCAKYLGAPVSSIYRVLRGERRSYQGNTFEYLEEPNG